MTIDLTTFSVEKLTRATYKITGKKEERKWSYITLEILQNQQNLNTWKMYKVTSKIKYVQDHRSFVVLFNI